MGGGRRRAAFTYTGVMVVAAMVAVLMAVAVFYYLRADERTRLVRIRADITRNGAVGEPAVRSGPASRPAPAKPSHTSPGSPLSCYHQNSSSIYWQAVFPALALRDQLDWEGEQDAPTEARISAPFLFHRD